MKRKKRLKKLKAIRKAFCEDGRLYGAMRQLLELMIESSKKGVDQ